MHTAQCNSIWQPEVVENLSVTCITCKKKLKSKLQSQIIFVLFSDYHGRIVVHVKEEKEEPRIPSLSDCDER